MDDDPRVGAVLQNRYRIIERLAEGGMGVVYRGERLTLERTVAIKFLHAGFAANADSIKRFERELKAMSRLNHPNCVSVIDYGFEEAPYYVMEYITGGTLKDEIGNGRVAAGRAIYITNQILAALTHAHGQGMVHRDIKPANVILTHAEGAHDHVYVLDFGLAKFMSSARNDDLTASWMVLGTPAYMSPEQARGDTVDVASDVYSTAVLLFELLTGEKPYASDNPIDTLQKHQSAPIPSLRERVPEGAFSEALDQVMCKALAKGTAQRFRTAGEFAEALDAVPEASYAPRASSQMRAQTGGLFALAERASSAEEMLSLADAMDVREATAGAARARSPGAGEAQAQAQAHTVPLQNRDDSGKQADGHAATAMLDASGAAASAAASAADEPDAPDAPAGKRGRKPAGKRGRKRAGKAVSAETVEMRKDSSPGNQRAVAAPTPAPAPAQQTPDPALAATAPAAGDTPAAAPAHAPGAGTQSTTKATTPSTRPSTTQATAPATPVRSGARVLFALLLPVGIATATWYLLYRPGQGDAQPNQDVAALVAETSAEETKGAGDPDASAEVDKPPPPKPVETIRDVEKLIEEGKSEEAIQGILKLRRTDFPNSGYLAMLLGDLYFDKVYWSDGLDAYQDALRLNRSYRTKAQINENAIRALSHDQARIKANRLFIRQIGRSGLPYLRKAAKADKNIKVRRRASWLIKQITKRRRRR